MPKFFEFYSNELKTQKEANLVYKNTLGGTQRINPEYMKYFRDSHYQTGLMSNLRQMFLQDVLLPEIFDTPQAALEYMENQAGKINDPKAKTEYLKSINSIKTGFRNNEKSVRQDMAAHRITDPETIQKGIMEANFRSIGTEIFRTGCRVKETSTTKLPLRTLQTYEDDSFDFFNYAFCDLEKDIGPENMKDIDALLSANAYQKGEVPDEYAGLNPKLYPVIFRPLKDTHHPKFKENEIREAEQNINALDIPDDEKENIKNALQKANSLLVDQNDDLSSELGGKEQQMDGSNLSGEYQHQVVDDNRNTYANGNLKTFIRGNTTLENLMEKERITRESYLNGIEEINTLKLTHSKENFDNIVELAEEMESMYSDYFSKPENIREMSYAGGAGAFFKLMLDSKRDLEKCIREKNYTQLPDKVKNYEETFQKYMQIMNKGKDLLSGTIPYLTQLNISASRNEFVPTDFSKVGDLSLSSRVVGVFQLVLSAKKCGMPVREFLKDPLLNVMKWQKNALENEGAHSYLNNLEFIKNPAQFESDIHKYKTKRFNYHINAMPSRALNQFSLLDNNVENIKNNCLAFDAMRNFAVERGIKDKTMLESIEMAVRNPHLNPQAYVSICGANLFGLAGKIRLGFDPEYGPEGFPVKKGELPTLGEVTPEMSKSDFYAKIDELSDAVRTAANAREKAPDYVAGFTAALYKGLKNQDWGVWSQEDVLNKLTVLKDQIFKAGVSNPALKAAIKEAEADCKLGMALKVPEKEDDPNAIRNADVSGLHDSLKNVRVSFASPEFSQMDTKLKELSGFAEELSKKSEPTKEEWRRYETLLKETRVLGESYLDKKQKQFFTKPSRTRSGSEHNRVVAVSRLVERLKMEEKLTEAENRFMYRGELSLRWLKSGKYDTMDASVSDSGKWFDDKAKKAAYAVVARMYRQAGYRDENDLKGFRDMLCNDKVFRTIVRKYNGTALAGVIEKNKFPEAMEIANKKYLEYKAETKVRKETLAYYKKNAMSNPGNRPGKGNEDPNKGLDHPNPFIK